MNDGSSGPRNERNGDIGREDRREAGKVRVARTDEGSTCVVIK